MTTIVRKVWGNRQSKQLLITIPKNVNICEGDYIIIKKLQMNEFTEKELIEGVVEANTK